MTEIVTKFFTAGPAFGRVAVDSAPDEFASGTYTARRQGVTFFSDKWVPFFIDNGALPQLIALYPNSDNCTNLPGSRYMYGAAINPHQMQPGLRNGDIGH